MSNNNRERTAGKIANAVQAAFEAMETRRLMSSVQVVDGVLVIDADPHTASNIIVDLHGPHGQIRGYCESVEAHFAAEGVRAIRITGSDGDDVITIAHSVKLPSLIRAGAGNDRVRGGSGVDTVDAGAGNDIVAGARGDDRLSGGDGNDVVLGNAGADVIDAGAGDDRAYGYGGDDTIYGGEGFDLLAGMGGDDKIYAGDGDDRVAGNRGTDQLYGGAGNDRIFVRGGRDQAAGGDGVDKIRGGGRNRVRAGGSNGERAPADLVRAPGIEPAPVDNGGGTTQPPPTQPPVENPPPANNPPAVEQPPVNNPPPGDVGGGNNGGDDTPPPTPNGPAPRPIIKMIGDDTRIVGQAVHVHGLDSRLNRGTPIHARYEWDFGDPTGRYNNLTGFNAAHVYDRPGVYTITLRVTNERGASATTTVQVSVAADPRATIYVDSVRGDDDNDGSTPERAVKTAEKAFEMVRDDTRVLFRRGQRFTVDRGMTINEDRVLVGAYGEGDLPVLYRVEGEGESVFRTSDAAEDVTFEDLRIDSEYHDDPNGVTPKVPVTGICTGGTNITVRDMEFGDVGNAVNANQHPTGLLVQDTVVTVPYGPRSYHVWGQGTDLVILGNTSTNSTREHNSRFSGAERVLLAHNNFRQNDRLEEDPADIQKGTIEIHRGAYTWITDNQVHGGVIRTGPRGGGLEPPDTYTDWIVIENNRLDDVGIRVQAGSHHIMVRNNVIERYESTRHGSAIHLCGPDRDNRIIDDVWVLNNTAIERRPSGQFLILEGPAADRGVTVRNNLWVNANFNSGSNGSAAMHLKVSNLDSFREISGNVWATPRTINSWVGNDGSHYFAPERRARGTYVTAQTWNDFDEVGTDFFTNDVRLRDVYQFRIDGVTAGSSLRIAA